MIITNYYYRAEPVAGPIKLNKLLYVKGYRLPHMIESIMDHLIILRGLFHNSDPEASGVAKRWH